MSTAKTFQGTARFEVQRRLGEGGMGVVYQAYDRERNAIVALKTLRQDDPAALYRFKQEFRSLADINHPNLVTLHELVFTGEHGRPSASGIAERSQWFFTMELIDGVDFLTYVRDEAGNNSSGLTDTLVAMPPSDPLKPREKPLRRPASPPPQPGGYNRLRQALRQLAEGVHALHEAGKLHRDIKPSNVLVTPSGRVVLVDFGLVTEINPSDFGSHNRLLVGTAVYMAPEQAVPETLSAASDWYSVGVILYEALTGTLPFDGPPLSVLMEKQESLPPAPRALLPETPADLDELCMALLQIDPQKRPSGRAILKHLGSQVVAMHRPQTISRANSEVFIGREQHLLLLDDAFAASQRAAITVFIHGRSGMGKTALLDRFLQRVASKDAVVLEGRCYERESVPYKALDTLVDSLSQYLMRLPAETAEALLSPDVAAVARLFPVLRRVSGIVVQRRPESSDPYELRRRATAALRALLGRIAARSPLVLSIDNLQWGDVESVELMAELVRPPDAPPLLLLACYRSEDASGSGAVRQLMRSLRTTGVAARDLIVGALSAQETRELVRRKLGDGSPEVAAYTEPLVTESRGNPFFVDELVRYILVGGVPPGSDSASISLEEAIAARVAQLPEGARTLLELVALAGRPMEQAVVAAAAELGPEHAKTLAVLRAGYLIRTRGAGEQDRIEIYHDRIRQTLVASLPPERTQTLHARLARALEASDRATPEALVFHFLGAGNAERAGHHAAMAADKAAEALAFDRAAEYYRLAVDCLPPAVAAAQRLRAKLGDALANAGKSRQAAEEYQHAAESANAAEALELRRRAAEQLLRAGYVDEGLTLLSAILGEIGLHLASSPHRALASLLSQRAKLRLYGLRSRIRDISQVSAEELTRIDICWTAAAGLGLTDPLNGADFQTRHMLLALKAGEPYRLARALALEAVYAAITSPSSQRRTHSLIAQANALASRIDNPHPRALALMASGITEYQTGQYARAREQLSRCIQILHEECTGTVFDLTAAQRIMMEVLLHLGAIGELCRLVPMRLRETERRGDLYGAGSMRSGWANIVWLAADDPERARKESSLGQNRWSHQGFHLHHFAHVLAHTNIELYTGDSTAARARVMAKWPVLQRSVVMRVQSLRCDALLLRARTATAHAALGGPASELDDAEQMAKKLAREAMPAAEPMALVVRAAIALARHDSLQCALHLGHAAHGFERADMKLMAMVCLRQRGVLIGGDQGRQLEHQADEWMRGQQIVRPARMAALLLGIPCSEPADTK